MLKKLSIIFTAILFTSILLLAGCAPGKVAVTAYDRQVELTLPGFEIDRLEPVVFPAGL